MSASLAPGPGAGSVSVSNHHIAHDLHQRFAHAKADARHLLHMLAARVRGKIFVYRGGAFDWTELLRDCIDFEKYKENSHGGDYYFARTMLAASAPWITHNASEARLFVVPSLLGMSQIVIFPSDVREQEKALDKLKLPNATCTAKIYENSLNRLVKALNASEYWGRRPHLFHTGGWQTLWGCGRSHAVNGSTVMRHCPFNVQTAARRRLLRTPKVIVAHFETREMTGDLDAAVSDPYVTSACTGSSEHGIAAYARPSAARPITFMFRGRMLHRPSRALVCAALRETVGDGLFLCRAQPGTEGIFRQLNITLRECPAPAAAATQPSLSQPPHDVDACVVNLTRAAAASGKRAAAPGGVCPQLAGCTSDLSPQGYCDEMSHARFAVQTRGDTPTSRRLYDAIELGALPTSLTPHLIENLSPIVNWSAFVSPEPVLDHEVITGLSSDTVLDRATVEAFAHLLQDEVDRSNAAASMNARQDAMLKWLPMLSWRHDPLTTSMHLLAQAALRIEALWPDNLRR